MVIAVPYDEMSVGEILERLSRPFRWRANCLERSCQNERWQAVWWGIKTQSLCSSRGLVLLTRHQSRM